MSDRKQQSFFVATDGDDSWSGQLDAPNGAKTDGPFASLERARNAIRQLRRDSELPAAVAVMVRGGRHYLRRTLVLGPEDSGTMECPITYAAYPGEKPILSGGRKIDGWEPYDGEILQCDLPEFSGGRRRFRQLFCNGKRQTRARYPKFDPGNPACGGWLLTESIEDVENPPSTPATPEVDTARTFQYKAGALPRHWARPQEAEVHLVTMNGVSNTVAVDRIDEATRRITLANSVKDYCRQAYDRDRANIRWHSAFYIENVLEELDQPGDWCLDSEHGVLYFWPPVDGTGSIETSDVVVPMLDCLIDLRVPAGQQIAWITISGFTFTETTGGDNMHPEGTEGCGAMSPGAGGGRTYCGETVHMRGATRCCLTNNHFAAVGGNAIYLDGQNVRNLVAHNEISGAGANGICLAGIRYFQLGRHYPLYNRIESNHIHHCGVFDKYAAGVFLGLSDSNVVCHNLIEQLPHHGINLGNSQYGRNIIEYNEVRDICRQTSDNGAINAWGEDPGGHVQKDADRAGHIIRYNLIVDVHGWEVRGDDSLGAPVCPADSSGIYLDNFTSNCLVQGNIIVRSGSVGIYVQGGKNNIMENNIVVDALCLSHLGGWWQSQMGEPSFMTGNRFYRNIFYRARGVPSIMYRHIGYKEEPLSDALGDSDYNLFFSEEGAEFAITESSSFLFPGLPYEWPGMKIVPLLEWKKAGFDTHSMFADPLFIDPAHDDFRLAPESPAIALGFEPFDLTKIGLLS
ncbi:MAG: right-handed parallel beta-helix repeat-containing protein [Lentisphaeria bacterium]|jgi:parallel beta-helix repeat protein|nr:right-handed parallel beta-helix repeat-containing protein [Lentisphaeria bacterium]MDP7742611.1 right-handed parallel beta-helix repeat-containing protein [Lentisphaeria bacterium]